MHIHLDNVRNLLPLLRPGVHTGGIVGTGMQQNHTLLWDCLSLKKKKKKKPLGGWTLGEVIPEHNGWECLLSSAIISVLQRCHPELP